MENVKEPNKYREGLIVYLNAPSASSLKTNTLKFRADYVGPLYIRELLGHDKTILCSMDGKILHGVFHVNRLKPGFIRLEKGSASHIDEVRRAYNEKQVKEIKQSPDSELKAAERKPETGIIPHTAAACIIQSYCSIQEDSSYDNLPVGAIIMSTTKDDTLDHSLYADHQGKNKNLGAPRELSYREQKKIRNHRKNLIEQGEEMSISKIRCKNGHIQLCLQGKDSNPGHAFWYDPRVHPNSCVVIANYLRKNRLKVHGSLEKLAQRTYVC